jgi:hypothetical protein
MRTNRILLPEDICNLAQLRKGNFMMETISISFRTLQTQKIYIWPFSVVILTYSFSEQFQLI